MKGRCPFTERQKRVKGYNCDDYKKYLIFQENCCLDFGAIPYTDLESYKRPVIVQALTIRYRRKPNYTRQSTCDKCGIVIKGGRIQLTKHKQKCHSY